MGCLGSEILVQLLEEEATKLQPFRLENNFVFKLHATGKCSKCNLRDVVRAYLNIRPLSLPLVCTHMHSFIHMLFEGSVNLTNFD